MVIENLNNHSFNLFSLFDQKNKIILSSNLYSLFGLFGGEKNAFENKNTLFNCGLYRIVTDNVGIHLVISYSTVYTLPNNFVRIWKMVVFQMIWVAYLIKFC